MSLTATRTAVPHSLPAGPVLFYDADCGLCDRFVQFVLRNERTQALRFAPLNGETFAPHRERLGESARDTVVLLDEAGFHVRSNAALRVLPFLRFPWPLVGKVGWCVPRVLRDAVYRLVARHRLKLFGRPDACRLPAGPSQARFLR